MKKNWLHPSYLIPHPFSLMYNRDIIQAYAFQGLILGLLAPLITCFVCLPLLYVGQTPNLSQTEQMGVLGIPFGLFVLLVGGGTAVFSWRTGEKRRAWLDAAFLPLGDGAELTSENHGVKGITYHGITDHDRQMVIAYQRGPWIEWSIETDLPGKLGITQNNPQSTQLSGLARRTPLKVPGASWEALALYAVADETNAAKQWLKNTAVQNALNTLLNHDNPFIIRQIILQNERFIYRLYRHKSLFQHSVTPEEAQAWHTALLLIINEAEERWP
jgi:hypothetical protein